MNPLIQKQFQDIEDSIDGIRYAFARLQKDAQHQQDQRDKLLQELWSKRKELASLNRLAEDYDSVEAKAQQYEAQKRELRERLRRVLDSLKALRSEFLS